ncbi:hypothetical protein PoB_006766300 [Plakobranchus ocellatus]|uniref:Secreted protein n=1 Tax=Plakobranchus ocellatus TaxID=259542 RepID=A0AAV4DA69_9GAST|nr:hypothetical protein PoB_006766300 [Plakobranchus ocellatus]
MWFLPFSSGRLTLLHQICFSPSTLCFSCWFHLRVFHGSFDCDFAGPSRTVYWPFVLILPGTELFRICFSCRDIATGRPTQWAGRYLSNTLCGGDPEAPWMPILTHCECPSGQPCGRREAISAYPQREGRILPDRGRKQGFHTARLHLHERLNGKRRI